MDPEIIPCTGTRYNNGLNLINTKKILDKLVDTNIVNIDITEINLEFPNTPHNFIDIETKEEVKLNPIEIRESFMEQTDLFLKDLKLRSLQHKIDLVEVDINKGIEQILISYLLKRQKMF